MKISWLVRTLTPLAGGEPKIEITPYDSRLSDPAGWDSIELSSKGEYRAFMAGIRQAGERVGWETCSWEHFEKVWHTECGRTFLSIVARCPQCGRVVEEE